MQNPNKSTFIPGRQDPTNNANTPKNFIEKTNHLNNFSSPALKNYYSPQINKNEERIERGNRGEISRSLFIE